MRPGRHYAAEREDCRRTGGSRASIGAAGLCLAALLVSQPLAAETKVLIVNSDMSVKKYKVAHDTFKESVAQPAQELDLAAKGSDKEKLAAVIQAQNPGLLYCIGSKAYLMVQEVAKERKIVLSSAINWQRFPVGDKTYGIANELSAGTQLTMFRFFFPGLKRVGVLYSKTFNEEWLRQTEKEAKDVEVEVRSEAVKKAAEVERSLRKLLAGVDALWLIPDPLVLADAKTLREIFSLCEAEKKPILAYDAAFAEQGAVLAISPDVPTIGRQAAALAEALLSDETIGERFQPPAGSEIVVNMTSVRRYGLKLNEDALDSVNRIIK